MKYISSDLLKMRNHESNDQANNKQRNHKHSPQLGSCFPLYPCFLSVLIRYIAIISTSILGRKLLFRNCFLQKFAKRLPALYLQECSNRQELTSVSKGFSECSGDLVSFLERATQYCRQGSIVGNAVLSATQYCRQGSIVGNAVLSARQYCRQGSIVGNAVLSATQLSATKYARKFNARYYLALNKDNLWHFVCGSTVPAALASTKYLNASSGGVRVCVILADMNSITPND